MAHVHGGGVAAFGLYLFLKDLLLGIFWCSCVHDAPVFSTLELHAGWCSGINDFVAYKTYHKFWPCAGVCTTQLASCMDGSTYLRFRLLFFPSYFVACDRLNYGSITRQTAETCIRTSSHRKGPLPEFQETLANNAALGRYVC